MWNPPGSFTCRAVACHHACSLSCPECAEHTHLFTPWPFFSASHTSAPFQHATGRPRVKAPATTALPTHPHTPPGSSAALHRRHARGCHSCACGRRTSPAPHALHLSPTAPFVPFTLQHASGRPTGTAPLIFPCHHPTPHTPRPAGVHHPGLPGHHAQDLAGAQPTAGVRGWRRVRPRAPHLQAA